MYAVAYFTMLWPLSFHSFYISVYVHTHHCLLFVLLWPLKFIIYQVKILLVDGCNVEFLAYYVISFESHVVCKKWISNITVFGNDRRKRIVWTEGFEIYWCVFLGEEGQDAGGLLREWYVIISREIFNPMYALFTTSPGDRVTYMINPSSHCNPNHLCYFKFVGRVIGKCCRFHEKLFKRLNVICNFV